MFQVLIRSFVLAILIALAGAPVAAQRERTRPGPRRQTAVTESQAGELTLTVTEVATRSVQVWIRTAGAIDASRRVVTAQVPASEGARLEVGQRVRAFSPDTRSRMHQGTVTGVTADEGRTAVRVTLAGPPLEDRRHFVLEIVTEAGDLLSVPNEAIIATGGRYLVYVQGGGGTYVPREIRPGVQGELYTQVLEGLTAGEQVVTIGSFFIDAEHRLKGS